MMAKTTVPSRSSSGKPASRAPAGAVDALQLLSEDHRALSQLFSAYQQLADRQAAPEERQALAIEICATLRTHAQVEEEIFYPSVREALDDDELVDEAEAEHDGVKDLIDEIESMSPQEDLYDAKLRLLEEQVAQHVREEEGEMFKRVRKTDLDLVSLGDQMESRRDQLVLEFTEVSQAL